MTMGGSAASITWAVLLPQLLVAASECSDFKLVFVSAMGVVKCIACKRRWPAMFWIVQLALLAQLQSDVVLQSYVHMHLRLSCWPCIELTNADSR